MRIKKKTTKTTILVLILILSLFLNAFLLYQSVQRNRVRRVVDGDSFDLTDGRRIRLLGIDAPDRNRCLYQASKDRLEQLINNRRVRLADLITDDYGRILANVYVNKQFVNLILVEEGLAKFSYVSSPQYLKLKQASIAAKNNRLGIYSPACQNTQAPTNCLIKGNLRAGDKVYHLPDCPNYMQVVIDEAFGDQWFCSEAEAEQHGFRKADGCQ